MATFSALKGYIIRGRLHDGPLDWRGEKVFRGAATHTLDQRHLISHHSGALPEIARYMSILPKQSVSLDRVVKKARAV